jgi:quercetin dioxygenase-like cupin family protein
MCQRRIALSIAVATACLTAPRQLRAQDTLTARAVIQRPVPPPPSPDMMVSLRELTLAPGASATNKHTHPGVVVVYVISGSIEVALGGQPTRVYRAGESFTEDPGQLHASTRNVSTTEPARFLAYVLSPKGVPLSSPVK